MGDPLAVLLIAGVHAVRVAVAAPAHGDAEPIQPALELVSVAAPGRARGWWEGRSTHLLHLPRGAGNRAGLGHGRRVSHSAWQGKGQEHPEVQEGVSGHARRAEKPAGFPAWEQRAPLGVGAFGSPGRMAADAPEGSSTARSLPEQDPGPRRGGQPAAAQGHRHSLGLTLVGAVGVSLVAVVPAVVVPVAGPVHRDAAPAVALELVAGAGVAAAGLIAVVATVVVWGGKRSGKGLRERPASQGRGLAAARQEGRRQRPHCQRHRPGEAGNGGDRTQTGHG